MRYWSILAAKLAVAAILLYGLWCGLHAWFDPKSYYGYGPFLYDLPWTTLMFFYNLLCNGVLVLIVLDQKYRCRTCGRRLRMPVTTGSHSHILLGPPRTEYICPYGHGTLKVQEIQLSGREPDDWEPHGDMWKELEKSGK